MRVAVLGDIGQPVYHVGDEAMAHAAVEELRSRGIDDVLLFTRDVEDTHARYSRVDAAPTLQFPWPPNDRRDYLRRIRAVLNGDDFELPPTDQVWEFVEAIKSCDALLIAGGGNMNSIYGWLLYERAAAISIARALGKPVVLGGQTLGPALHGDDRATATQMLGEASLIGGREASTVQLANDLDSSATVGECLDDAAFFATRASEKPAEEPEPAGELPQHYAAVTFAAPSGCVRNSTAYENYVRSVATFLTHAEQITELPLVFLPHMSTPGANDGDEATHRDIVTAMDGDQKYLMPIQSARRTAEITAQAALVLTSRYHPVIFAMNGATPVVAVAVDSYSSTRLGGALAQWGLEDFVLPLPSLVDGTVEPALQEVWVNRERISAHCKAAKAQRRREFDGWWDQVVRALKGETLSTSPLTEVAKWPAKEPWIDRAAAAASTFLPLSAEVEELRVVREHLAGELDLARRDAENAKDELQGWFASRSFRAVSAVASLRSRVKGQ
ncbi:polysaccharide pyruvyl transferase family protein [uncultured Arthrobacter sp.]|uniref:polysaccharide pyruvyl transferase family protein n=1 Tax=uncultured Arthrobacter sp. TaxID=114050 RepID=UPI0026104BC0|nr:polysaccharide pyruvyl transferase family protein [uncultured Arthrobacter sp.]